MSSRNTRSRKQPIKNSAFSVSMASLASAFTQTSKSSSGSNSTVTQESHSSSKQGVSKRSTGQTRRISRKESSSHKSSDHGKRPNVFAFRVDDDEEERDVVGDLPSDSDVPSPPDFEESESPPVPDMPVAPQPPISAKLPTFAEGFEQMIPDRPLSFASLHSDSGISIRSASPERPSPKMTQKPASKPFLEKSKARSKPMVRGNSNNSMASSSSGTRPPPQTWQGTPESYYSSGSQPERTTKQITRRTTSKKSSTSISTSKSKPNTKAPRQLPAQPTLTPSKGGYDLLASSLSTLPTVDSDTPKPLYRRFEALNNRILLVLQDEISTMENDLSVMDALIANESPPGPTSRRSELQAPTPLQSNRTVLYGCLMQKLSIYNKAFASYNALSSLPSPTETLVDTYKSFLNTTHPLVASETAFLNHLSDLATVASASASTSPFHGNRNGVRSEEEVAVADKSALTACAAMLFTIVVFKLVPSFVARVVLGVMVVGVGVGSGMLPGEMRGAEGTERKNGGGEEEEGSEEGSDDEEDEDGDEDESDEGEDGGKVIRKRVEQKGLGWDRGWEITWVGRRTGG
ncbi:hypothetical protein MMC10_002794 [Thelotrema lepadinum]|nr:hypothetical protein [Thelotrema lepadinum]